MHRSIICTFYVGRKSCLVKYVNSTVTKYLNFKVVNTSEGCWVVWEHMNQKVQFERLLNATMSKFINVQILWIQTRMSEGLKFYFTAAKHFSVALLSFSSLISLNGGKFQGQSDDKIHSVSSQNAAGPVHEWLKCWTRPGPVMELGMWRMLRSSPCTALWRNPPRLQWSCEAAPAGSRIHFNSTPLCVGRWLTARPRLRTSLPLLPSRSRLCCIRGSGSMFQHFFMLYLLCTVSVWLVSVSLW